MQSIKLFKLFGIPLELHYTFILLVAVMLCATAIFEPNSLASNALLLFFIFASVFLHELSHSVVAMGKGIKIQKIILLPIGGVALSEKQPKKPSDELLIALAGPAFNFSVIIGILAITSIIPNVPFWPYDLMNTYSSMAPEALAEAMNSAIMNYPLFALLWVNLMLGAFNLFIPAFPMDGGRALRAGLALFIPFNKATKIASTISKIISAFIALIAFFAGELFLFVIALFVFWGATKENELVETEFILGKKSIESAVKPAKKILSGETTLIEAINQLNELNESSVLVELNENSFAEFNARNSLNEKNLAKPVKDLSFKLPNISINTPAIKALQFFQSNDATVLPIFDGKEFKGELRENELRKMLLLTELNKKIRKG